jgi:uroporphyrinogen-III decarboxylase
MDRNFYLDLAARGLRWPIGTDLVLHEQNDPESIVLDGRRLGAVVAAAARRYKTPLAIPLMDLRLEKADLLDTLAVAAADVDAFHFSEAPAQDVLDRVTASGAAPFGPRQRAHFEAIRYIARETDLVPVGMCIGPFSLMTKLLADPITAIAMAGVGVTAAEDAGVLGVERCLALAEMAVARSLAAQAQAGARAVLVCEPAANAVYLSPKRIEAGSDIFERYVMQPNLRLRAQLDRAGVDLIFHDCGQLIPFFVEQFATRLHPVMLSFGSSRQLWEDAALVPPDVVLYGNLPTKNFYSDAALPLEKVRALTVDLLERMRETGHPHILGSECDVLHVPDAAATIRAKVDLMLSCTAGPA